MNRRLILCVWMLWFLASPPVLSAKPIIQSSEIQKYQKQLQQLLTLSLKNGRVRINRDEWFHYSGGTVKDYMVRARDEIVKNNLQEKIKSKEKIRTMAELLCALDLSENLRRVTRAWSSGSSMGPDMQEIRFSTEKINARISVQYSTGLFSFTLKDEKNPKSRIQISDRSNGVFELELKANNNNLVLKITQSETGSITLEYKDQHESIDEKFEVANFAELLKTRNAFMTENILPFLQALGINPPLTRLHPLVIEAALSLSIPISESIQDEIKKYIYLLNDYDFEIRESASEKLKKYYFDYPEIIESYLDHNWPAEVHERLQQITAGLPRRKEAEDFVMEMELAGNLEYFTEIINLVNEKQQNRLIRVLQDLTKLQYATMEEWKVWADSR